MVTQVITSAFLQRAEH